MSHEKGSPLLDVRLLYQAVEDHRLHTGLTRAALARRLGISPAAAARLRPTENPTQPTGETLTRILQWLRVPVDTFFIIKEEEKIIEEGKREWGGDHQDSNPSPTEEKILLFKTIDNLSILGEGKKELLKNITQIMIDQEG